MYESYAEDMATGKRYQEIINKQSIGSLDGYAAWQNKFDGYMAKIVGVYRRIGEYGKRINEYEHIINALESIEAYNTRAERDVTVAFDAIEPADIIMRISRQPSDSKDDR